MAEVVIEDMAVGNPASLLSPKWRFESQSPARSITQMPGRVMVHCGYNPDAMQQFQFSVMLVRDYPPPAEGNVNNSLMPFLFGNRHDIWRLALWTI